uniref:Uncharacterized protein n=1 Tax=Leersia perrieri TaxID=77586 RepID=A0A0D9WSN2_9ORYZ
MATPPGRRSSAVASLRHAGISSQPPSHLTHRRPRRIGRRRFPPLLGDPPPSSLSSCPDPLPTMTGTA